MENPKKLKPSLLRRCQTWAQKVTTPWFPLREKKPTLLQEWSKWVDLHEPEKSHLLPR